VSNVAKARYNANAYVQLIRQVSRLNLNSAVSIRPVQIGCAVDKELMCRNLEEIAGVACDSKIKLWIEHDGTSGMHDQLSLYRKLRSQYSNVGVEIQPARARAAVALDGGIEPKDLVKVRCYPGSDGKREQKSTVGIYANYIDRLLSQRAEVSVWERDFDMIRKIASTNPNYKKNVAFEIPLGYSTNNLKKLQQYKLDLSVYVPFGKDWVRIAVALLDGKGEEHGSEN
jgi:proline dehydrogenase